MRLTKLIVLGSFASLFVLAVDEKAILRFEPARQPVERNIYVTGDRPEDLKNVRVTLLAKGHAPKQLEVKASSDFAFKLEVPQTITFTPADMPFLLIEHIGKPSFFLLKLEHELSVTLGEPECSDLPNAHAAVVVIGQPQGSSRAYLRDRLDAIAETMKTLTGLDMSAEISAEAKS